VYINSKIFVKYCTRRVHHDEADPDDEVSMTKQTCSSAWKSLPELSSMSIIVESSYLSLREISDTIFGTIDHIFSLTEGLCTA
jgi:hypothetical protein